MVIVQLITTVALPGPVKIKSVELLDLTNITILAVIALIISQPLWYSCATASSGVILLQCLH